MCGIAGTYRWPDGKAVTDRLTETLAHRGPDGSGTYAHSLGDGEVHLGHRRLAILDLSGTGAQPMVSPLSRQETHAGAHSSPGIQTQPRPWMSAQRP